ncbi:hypothetical protein [Streptomyces sp. 1331.2]|uniref:hypothetical protein n=1 Tax=Streptomyces sp. 1331.2 TaxID=1938835 RepID=UPI000BD75E86|nr:hypothetical protein [Streptomyces sp. 1331.2]SOB82315.1 hypothetical protein SAMN06272789_2473 [Streptomyces sp. 1331.2]
MSDHPENGGGFQVAPNELQQTASTAIETAGELPGDLKALAETTHQSTAGLTGLRCGAALDACTGAWHTLLTDLHTTLARQGQGLVDSGLGYASADQRIDSAFGPDTRTDAPTAQQQQNFVLHFG